MMKKALVILFIFLLGLKNTTMGQSSINWQHFLAKSDMVFDTLTTKWEEGAFIGNGLLGSMIYMQDRYSLRFDVGRSDVCDHRQDIKSKSASELSALFKEGRLPIGHFTLKPSGNIITSTARVDLWNAEARGVITTTKGQVSWKAVALAQMNVILVEMDFTPGEKDFQWRWHPDTSDNPRNKFAVRDANYAMNPLFELKNQGDVHYCFQPILGGGDYTTAWTSNGQRGKKIFYISIGYSHLDSSSLKEALRNIHSAKSIAPDSLIRHHRDWWHNYYPQSFIAMPDKRMESFYWIQQYKLASATRAGNSPIDLMGPWFYPTPWPAYWYNLNIQLTYSPLFTANRLQLASTLMDAIDKNVQNLINNAPEEYRYNSLALGRAGGEDMIAPVTATGNSTINSVPSSMEVGDATWMLYYYWQYYRYTMDEPVMRKLFPLLKRSINYYIHLLKKEDDGKWHLSCTYSPEYPHGITRDCNYDLSLLRWGCTTLLKMNDQLKAGDKLEEKWKDILQDLTPYPVNKNGLMIGRDVPLAISHRHYSHLLMIYPLHIMNWDQPGNRPLIERSLLYWHSMPKAMRGYSWTGGGSIYAEMGRGDKTRDYLDTLLIKYIKPNTMYLESGPVIETPLAAAATIQEIFLQYWNDKIRVFSAIPGDWKEASFKDLRTEGAFLISAVRKNGETQWVGIKSLQGGLCHILPGLKGEVKINSTEPAVLKNKGDGTYEIKLRKGQEIFLFTEKNALRIPISETKQHMGKNNYWGKKRKGGNHE